MFERFTQEARDAVVAAQEVARTRGDGRIDSRHLLIGVLSLGAIAEIAERFALRRDDILSALSELDAPIAGHIAFSPRAKACLEQSLRESLRMGSNRITPEHLLLGIIRAESGARRLMIAHGIDLELLAAALQDAAGRPIVSGVFLDRLSYAKAAMEQVRHARSYESTPSAPGCPGCRADLGEHLRCRKVEAVGDDGSVWVWLFYCGACGRTINAGGGDEGAVPAHG